PRSRCLRVPRCRRGGWPAPLPLTHVREEGHFTGALHGDAQLGLMLAGQAGDSTRPGLALVGDEPAQQRQVLVIEVLSRNLGVLARTNPLAEAAPALG